MVTENCKKIEPVVVKLRWKQNISLFFWTRCIYSYWRTSPSLNKLYNIQLQYFRAKFFYICDCAQLYWRVYFKADSPAEMFAQQPSSRYYSILLPGLCHGHRWISCHIENWLWHRECYGCDHSVVVSGHHVYGTSPGNHCIEAWWSFYRRQHSQSTCQVSVWTWAEVRTTLQLVMPLMRNSSWIQLM